MHTSNVTEPSPKRIDHRWWEFYAVRYAMGTVVGGVLFYGLASVVSSMAPMINHGKLDGWLLPLLAAYGLTFCYIASAPMLVLHAARFALNLDASFFRKLFACCAIVAMVVVIAGVTERLFQNGLYTVVYTLTSSIVLLELYLCGVIIFRNTDLYGFYQRLSRSRNEASPDFVESYRHLREHGNSFAIVFFEVILAGTAYCIIDQTGNSPADVASRMGILIVLWTVPGMMVWFAGTLLERRLAESSA